MPSWRLTHRPSLASLFLAFISIGMMSFGGGLPPGSAARWCSAANGWTTSSSCPAIALSQLVPGATNVNLSVFIGAQLRGMPGAVAAVAGLTALPVAIVLALGALYLRSPRPARRRVVQRRADRHGGSGDRPQPRHRHPAWPAAYSPVIAPALVTAAIALAIGVFGIPLLHVLAVMVPVSLLLAWLEHRR